MGTPTLPPSPEVLVRAFLLCKSVDPCEGHAGSYNLVMVSSQVPVLWSRLGKPYRMDVAGYLALEREDVKLAHELALGILDPDGAVLDQKAVAWPRSDTARSLVLVIPQLTLQGPELKIGCHQVVVSIDGDLAGFAPLYVYGVDGAAIPGGGTPSGDPRGH